MRLSELIKMNVGDVDLDDKSIKIICKGNKERKIYLNNNTYEKFKEFLDLQNSNDKSAPVFVNRNKNRIGRRDVQEICKKAYELAGLSEYGFSTHTLRHTFATIMYENGKEDVLLLKELLGHESVVSTQIYTHVSSEKLRKAFDSNPLNNLEIAG